MRHPKHRIILRSTNTIIDCSTVTSVVYTPMKDESGREIHMVIVGFLGSDRTLKLVSEDHEAAIVTMTRLHRAMIAASNGEWGLLEDWGGEGDDDDDDDDIGPPGPAGPAKPVPLGPRPRFG